MFVIIGQSDMADSFVKAKDLKEGDVIASSFDNRAIVIKADNINNLWQYQFVDTDIVVTIDDPDYITAFTVIRSFDTVEEAKNSEVSKILPSVFVEKTINTDTGEIVFVINGKTISFDVGKKLWNALLKYHKGVWYERFGSEYNSLLNKWDYIVEIIRVDTNTIDNNPYINSIIKDSM